MKTLFAALFVTVLVAGCMSRKKMRNQPYDAGEQRVYKVEFEKARMASRDGLAEAGFNIHDDEAISESVWRLQGFKSTTANPSGRFGRIIVERRERDVSVRVLVKSKVESSDTEKLDATIAQDIHERIAKRLKQ